MNAPIPLGAIEIDRTTYLGGADTAAILGVSPWTSPFLLYQKKVGLFTEEIEEEKQRIFNRGKRWEPIVIEMLVDDLERRGHAVEIVGKNQRYQDPEYPFLAAEIDLELIIDGEPVNGECKTVSPFAVKHGWGELETDEIPVYYTAQVMHGLMIQPRRRTVVAALTGFDDRPRIHWVERDDDIIAGIRAKEIAFWQRVQDKIPPPPTTLADVQFLYPQDAGTAIEADDDLAALCAEIKEAKAGAKRADEHLEALTTRLKIAMGDAALLTFGGKPIATWKNNKPSVKTDWKALVHHHWPVPPADLVEQFTRTQPGARPLLIK